MYEMEVNETKTRNFLVQYSDADGGFENHFGKLHQLSCSGSICSHSVFLRRPPLCIYIHNIARETGSVHAIEFFSKYDLERSPRHRSLGAERECRCLTRIVLFRQFLTPRTEVPPFRQRKTIQLKVPPRRLGGWQVSQQANIFRSAHIFPSPRRISPC